MSLVQLHKIVLIIWMFTGLWNSYPLVWPAGNCIEPQLHAKHQTIGRAAQTVALVSSLHKWVNSDSLQGGMTSREQWSEMRLPSDSASVSKSISSSFLTFTGASCGTLSFTVDNFKKPNELSVLQKQGLQAHRTSEGWNNAFWGLVSAPTIGRS